MIKKLTAVMTALTLLFTSLIFTGSFTASAASSSSFALLAKEKTYVRSSASSSGSTLYTLNSNSYITALGAASNGWYKVEYASGKSGYIAEASVSKDSKSYAAFVDVSSGTLNVRSGPGTSYDKVTALSKGYNVVALSKSNGWTKILYNGVSIGYVNSDYISAAPTASSSVSSATTEKVAKKFVSIALAEKGYKEGSNNYNKYGAYFGSPNVAWCDVFVLWCASQTDTALYGTAFPKLRGCTSIMNWYKNKGRYKSSSSGYTPKAGDLIFYNTSGGTTTSTHMGIVTSYSSGYCNTIEGNYSNKVSARKVSATHSTVIGFAAPDFSYAKNLIPTLNTTTTTTKATTTTTTTIKDVDRVSKTTPTAAPVQTAEVVPTQALSESIQPEEAVVSEVTSTTPAAVTTTSTSTTSTTVTTTSTTTTTTANVTIEPEIPVEEEPQVLTATVNVPLLNMRSSADSNAEKVAVLTQDQQAEIVSETEEYYELNLENGIIGYVLKKYVTASATEEQKISTGVIDADVFNVRSGADLSSDKVSVLTRNASVTIIDKEDVWCKVQLANDIVGYILSCYVVE